MTSHLYYTAYTHTYDLSELVQTCMMYASKGDATSARHIKIICQWFTIPSQFWESCKAIDVFVLCQFEVKEQAPADAPPGNIVSTPGEVDEGVWGQQSSSKATAALCKEDQEEHCNMLSTLSVSDGVY